MVNGRLKRGGAVGWAKRSVPAIRCRDREMVGTALRAFGYPTAPSFAAPSSPSGGLQRLRRVDVEEGALAIDRHFGHGLGVLGDQMTRADVAVERH